VNYSNLSESDIRILVMRPGAREIIRQLVLTDNLIRRDVISASGDIEHVYSVKDEYIPYLKQQEQVEGKL